MNNLLIAEMFEGDRTQALAALHTSLRPTNGGTDLPKCMVKLDKRELCPEAPPRATREFDIIRL